MRFSRRRNPVLTLLWLAIAIAVSGVLAAGLLVPYVLGIGLVSRAEADRFLGVTCDLTESPPPQKSYIYASDRRTVLAALFAQNRSPVSLSQVPKYLQEALIATEDRRFYSHHGVDLRGLVRAAVNNAEGSSTQGGSTLTMQYVKQIRYYQATTDQQRQAAIEPNLDRKILDARCALDLEKRNSKAEILDKYLNIAFFGENSYGISTAAETYFSVPVSRLTLPQSAMLVGLLQAPSLYDPFDDPQAARQRRDRVIQNLADVGDITRAQAVAYQGAPLKIATSQPPPVKEGCSYANPAVLNAGFFCDYAVQWLQQHGFTSRALDTAGLKIVTTLDAGLQISAQRAIWTAGLNPAADYVLVMPSVDPKTGDVTTMITSRRYGINARDGAQSSDPLLTNAYAGSGSTYKYFTALAALTAGVPPSFSLSTPGNSYTTKHCASGTFTVRNAGNYQSTLPLSVALPQSSNTYFVAMEDELFGCNLTGPVNMALSLGMNRLRQRLNASAISSIATEVVQSQEPTFTLGEEPTSPLELTGAFAAAVNDGIFCPPSPIKAVLGSNGAVVALHKSPCRREISSYVARTIMTMMRADTHTGTAAGYFGNWYDNGGSDVAAKTGTDNNAADNGNSALWFVGMTPHLVSAAALVNPVNPKQTVHDLPNMPGDWVGQDIFGAYASTYWLAAYGPTLTSQPWTWSEVGELPNTVPVPSVLGQEPAAAAATLAEAGFKSATYPVPCGSSMAQGTIAYEQPPRAHPGSSVVLCISSGIAPYVYVPPAYTPPPRPVAPPPAPEPPAAGPPATRPPALVPPTPTLPPVPLPTLVPPRR